ncbi:unnamed protein product [Cuscuta europaea]|uniref:Uncharacterized protein n=1 Tax=Cuscuta europaea TaxID=41803 RepID=A0A9P0Z6T9_CUSEU|nr:unnamed protein product [Cuscuta europaea]
MSVATAKDYEKFNFFGEEDFDSIKIESKIFRFATRNNEIVIFEIKKSSLKRINFKTVMAPGIFQFIQQLSCSNKFNLVQTGKFGNITVMSLLNNSGCYVKIANDKGSSILIPRGTQFKPQRFFDIIFKNCWIVLFRAGGPYALGA